MAETIAAVPDFIPDDAGASEYALGVRSSFSGRAWRFRVCDDSVADELAHAGMPVALARMLAARGLTPATVEDFLEPRLKALLPEPHSLAHMEKAASRMVDALTQSQTVAVFGDYDVDGACASALLLRFLRGLGMSPLLYIPDRIREGYGPSAGAMRSLRAQGADVVITVDCGAAAHEALAAARQLGMDVLVLDHHQVAENPPAFAHVNPNGPDDNSGLTYLCAAGVTFCFLVAVRRLLRERGWFAAHAIPEPDLYALLDIVALATVADVVPLVGLNRAFVRQGLRVLERLERPGLAALAQLGAAEPPFTPHHLGFVFGPRINAGGRVGRCDLGARLLATDDIEEAEESAFELHRHNRERQAIEAAILEDAEARALAQRENAFVFLAGDGWHPGVVGIVASRLKERLGLPALVAGFTDDTPECLGRGSARSVSGLDLGAIVRAAHAAGYLEAGGGHAMAAGFSLTRAQVPAFTEFLQSRMQTQRGLIADSWALVADSSVAAGGANLELLDALERASPFGSGNPEPILLLADLVVKYADIVGSNHIRLRLEGRDGSTLGAMAFRAVGTPLGDGLLKSRGKRAHFAGKMRRDLYGGTPKLVLHVEDAAPAFL